MDEIYWIVLHASVKQMKWDTILFLTLLFGLSSGLILYYLEDDRFKFIFRISSVIVVFFIWSYYVRWYLALTPCLYIISCFSYYSTSTQLNRFKSQYDEKRNLAREKYEKQAYELINDNGVNLQSYKGNLKVEYDNLMELNKLIKLREELSTLKERKVNSLAMSVILFFILFFCMLGFEYKDYLIPMDDADRWMYELR